MDLDRKALKVKNRATGKIVAYLAPNPDNITKCRIDKGLNAEVKLKFILPMDSEKWDYIDDIYSIEVNGHEFLLVGKEEERDEKGILVSNVQYEESYIDLGQLYTNYVEVEILSSDANSALTQILAGTGWTVGVVDVTGIHDLETEKLSCLANVQKVREIWGGYLKFDSVSKTVSLVQNPGQEKPVHIRHGKNQIKITREVDPIVVNRLIPYGSDGLDIKSVNNDILYVENYDYIRGKLGLGDTDPIPKWAIKEGTYERRDIDEPPKLLEAALKEVARISRPRVKYSIKMVDLRELSGHEDEVFDVGDVVRIYDEEFKAIDVKQMIIKYSYDVFERQDADVEIGDPLPTFEEELADMSWASKVLNEQVAPAAGLKNLLKGLIIGEAKEILSANGRIQFTQNSFKIIETNDLGEPTGGEIVLTPKGIVLKDPLGNEYDLAISSKGVLASKIIANALYALSSEDGYTKMVSDGLHVYDDTPENPVKKVHIGQYSPGKFGVKVIDGAFELVTAEIGRRMEILPTGIFFYDDQDKPTMSLDVATGAKITLAYSEITGDKPPVDADKTATVIMAGLVTTGTIELTDTGGITKAGVTGGGSGDSSVRIWAGATYSSRASAPFRVTQGGKVTASNIDIVGGTINVGTDITVGNNIYLSGNGDRAIVLNGSASIDFQSSTDSMILGALNAVSIQGDWHFYSWGVDAYSPLDMNNYDISGIYKIFTFKLQVDENAWIYGNTGMSGDLNVYGAKNAVVPTQNYGHRLLYSYEGAESKFMDDGTAQLVSGEARIDLDPMWLETVDILTDNDYIVDVLTPIGACIKLAVKEKCATYFVIMAEDPAANIQFDWGIRATRKGYKGVRLFQHLQQGA